MTNTVLLDEFEYLKETIKDLIHFNCDYYRDSYLKRRISTRMRSLGIKSFSEYAHVLKHDPMERKNLLDALTINVTQFFRNPEAFEALKTHVILPLIHDGHGTPLKPITVWSAGCSDGREPYTVAMVIADCMGGRIKPGCVEIVATDIDDAMLEIGINGTYVDLPLQNIKDQVPLEYLKKYFKIKENKYIVRADLKNAVRFRHHDLLSDEKLPMKFDIVICRNVLIYFPKDRQLIVFDTLLDAMKPGGYLMLGKTETLFGKAREILVPIDLRERIYQKPVNYLPANASRLYRS